MKRMPAGVAVAMMAMALVSCGGGGDGESSGLAGAQASASTQAPGLVQGANSKTEDLGAVQALTAVQADSTGGVAAALGQGEQGRAELLELAGSAAGLPIIEFDASVESAPISVKFFERQTPTFAVDAAITVRSKLPYGASPWVADNEAHIVADSNGSRYVLLWPNGPGKFRAIQGLPINTQKLTRGTYIGALRVEVLPYTSSRAYPTSTPPVLIPYDITVVPPFDVSVEVNGVLVPFQPSLDGVVKYIDVKNGDTITVRSSEVSSWGTSSGGVAFLNTVQAEKSWMATVDLRTNSDYAFFSLKAAVYDHLPATYWAEEWAHFRVNR
ncbi:hypothetical protein [Variovorax sp. 350MFTsu5.1]|uniref:hypothetical protein n=1 Tax=Variovorax sp. 350MFTsu5.1 TaxID=3158365 RepID=UPI003AAA4D26